MKTLLNFSMTMLLGLFLCSCVSLNKKQPEPVIEPTPVAPQNQPAPFVQKQVTKKQNKKPKPSTASTEKKLDVDATTTTEEAVPDATEALANEDLSINPESGITNSPPTGAEAAVERAKIPFGTPVPGKEGMVFSPFSPDAGYVDVSGIPSGTRVKDPFTGKEFMVP